MLRSLRVRNHSSKCNLKTAKMIKINVNISANVAVVFLIVFLMSNCKDEIGSYDQLIQKAIDEVEISCEEIRSDDYFHAYLNGEDLCYSAGFDDYRIYSGVTNSVITSEPSIDFSNTSSYETNGYWYTFSFHTSLPNNKHLQDHVKFETPISDTIRTGKEFAEEHFKVGTHPIRNIENEKEGFNITFTIPYREDDKENENLEWQGSSGVDFKTSNGTQENSYFRINKVNVSEDEQYYYYLLECDFSGSLYYPRTRVDQSEFELFGELTEGNMTMNVAVYKE